MEELDVVNHDVERLQDENLWAEQQYLLHRRLLREIFPTPTFGGLCACTLLVAIRARPKTAFGWAGVLGGGVLSFLAVRGLELVKYIVKQEVVGQWELQDQRVAFHQSVMEALEAKGAGEPIPVPEELKAVEGRHNLFVYHAPMATPLWFRRLDGEGEEGCSHDWQWTPDLKTWVDLDTMKVPSGIWEGQEPAPSNKVLLNRLKVLQSLSRQAFSRAAAKPPPLRLPPIPHDVDIPSSFLCPISHDIMTDPVVSPSGVTYDRPGITMWLNHHDHEPATNRRLFPYNLYPNLALRDQIETWVSSLQLAT
mmetsp:Transcript_21638/g.60144  ORF Transcript_21638/g.60144 Transcript_21638/m.60144 type:complete len:308 (-) Transcript_21638:737-1660(-)|eukprot:CAMPEP_0117648564 /NCGR_PEP_ID=MMETSP0804-20121206/477_1 /TAXON_ID=1074897 /ORGANISM="Tetraselmis astigmatica, Strain CCMP880" /LENGTH=307 /DNA_ID=CAMNT_0005454185 /DNA_START=247 /DNA_END=1170 /DNA_ORIENTATION=+